MASDIDRHSEALDPRIKDELEKLNESTKAINRLEIELDESRADFRQALTDSTQSLNAVAKKLGSCIDKARPYYEARHKAKEVQSETQRAALRYEKANSMLAAAKEMLEVAESGVYGRKLDANWQEMLNHATMKVNQAEWERSMSELDHQKTANLFNSSEKQVSKLQKALKKHITKSRPYFETKAHLSQQLQDRKGCVTRLERRVLESKRSYSEALRCLESISEEIHRRRQQRQVAPLPSSAHRGAGVGAEAQDTAPFCEEEEAVVEAALACRQISGSSDLCPAGDDLCHPDLCPADLCEDEEACADPHSILSDCESTDHLDQIGLDDEDELVGTYPGLEDLASGAGGHTADYHQAEGTSQSNRTANYDLGEGTSQGDHTADCDSSEGTSQGDRTADCDLPEGTSQSDRTADCDLPEGAGQSDSNQSENTASPGDHSADCDQAKDATASLGDHTSDIDQAGDASHDDRTTDVDEPGDATVNE